MFEVYDKVKVKKMGKEQGYMGSFPTHAEAMRYCIKYMHLFENTRLSGEACSYESEIVEVRPETTKEYGRE